jgi:hypothetical protein
VVVNNDTHLVKHGTGGVRSVVVLPDASQMLGLLEHHDVMTRLLQALGGDCTTFKRQHAGETGDFDYRLVVEQTY